jgi:branched-chain amino acid transport system permease protein
MLMTLGFNIIMVSLGENLTRWTNGAKGMCPVPRVTNFWWVFGIAVFVVYLALRIKGSRLGRTLIAVGKDATLSETMGINVAQARMTAFAISSFFTGVAGVLLVHMIGNLFPNHFGLSLVFDVVMMLIIGGMGSITGSVVGAAIVTTFVEILSPLQEGIVIFGYKLPRMFGLVEVVFGVALIVLLIFRPHGIMGERELTLSSVIAPMRGAWARLRPGRHAQ